MPFSKKENKGIRVDASLKGKIKHHRPNEIGQRLQNDEWLNSMLSLISEYDELVISEESTIVASSNLFHMHVRENNSFPCCLFVPLF